MQDLPGSSGSAASGTYRPMTKMENTPPFLSSVGNRTELNPRQVWTNAPGAGRGTHGERGISVPRPVTAQSLSAPPSSFSGSPKAAELHRRYTRRRGGAPEEEDDDEDWSVKKMVKSDLFQGIVAGAILSNVVSMAVETDHGDWTLCWQIVNNLFCTFFVFEISCRIYVGGRSFWVCCPEDKEEECFWNYFDFSIAVLCVLDLWVKQLIVLWLSTGSEESHRSSPLTKFLMILRMLRILRIVRVARIFHFSPSLLMLVNGIVESVLLVFWIAVLLFVFMLVFAIFFTEVVGDDAEAFEKPELIRKYWGGVLTSMVTLFQFITLDDWSAISRQVVNTKPWMQLVFDAYIFTAAFAILSLLTAVVADHMSEVSQNEKDQAEKQKDQALVVLLDGLEKCHQSDDINVDIFRGIIRSDKVKEGLKEAGIEIEEDEEDRMFDFLDKKGYGFLSWQELSDGLVRLRGEVSSQDFLSMRCAAERVARRLETDTTKLNEVDWCMNEVEATLGDMADQIQKFMDFVESDE
eukprot:TRINITY_DN112250_c0_g1_i1.p1 TRINITY_DN112250_c0_g1~~TRINITY_DN112250_c0_g1_i1.p1  ORF type:complete len:521 (+),score=147.70 TRINITY_DN112250_c0_g1_i1:181-1743(+)